MITSPAAAVLLSCATRRSVMRSIKSARLLLLQGMEHSREGSETHHHRRQPILDAVVGRQPHMLQRDHRLQDLGAAGK